MNWGLAGGERREFSDRLLWLDQIWMLEPTREEFGCSADIIDFLDAVGFHASFVASIGIRAILFDEVSQYHFLAINGEDTLVIFTVYSLGLTAGRHFLIYH